MRDRAVAVDVGSVTLASGTELTLDFIVLATGSTYPFPAKSGTDDTATAVVHYRASHDELAQAERVLIVGAGPTGLELAGEISERWPDKKVTILEPEPEILAGPYKQELRDEVRRQLEERGVTFVLGEALSAEPESPPATFGRFATSTVTGRTVEADIWFRCHGLAPPAGTSGSASERPPARGLDRGDAGAPGRRADERVRDRRRRRRRSEDRGSRGPGGRGRRRQHPRDSRRGRAPGLRADAPVDRDPARASGGASEPPGHDEIAGTETTTAIKGEHMFVDAYRDLFGLEAPVPVSSA